MGIFRKNGGLDMRHSVNQGGGCVSSIIFIIIVLGVIIALLRQCGIDPLGNEEKKEIENRYHPTENPWGE